MLVGNQLKTPTDWPAQLVRDGFIQVPRLTPPALVTEARHAIERDLTDNFDLTRAREYEERSFCPDIRSSPAILQLLHNTPVRTLLDAVLGFDRLAYEPGQIAIRKARSHRRRVRPEAHIDGIASALNGVCGPELATFTALLGVFLTDTPASFAGNFTVWPGSHRSIAGYFRDRGAEAMSEGMPPVSIGAPAQLACKAGDVVICNYALAHAAARNVSASDRVAVFFRLALIDLADLRWHRLVNPWDGWRVDPEATASEIDHTAVAFIDRTLQLSAGALDTARSSRSPIDALTGLVTRLGNLRRGSSA